MQRTPKPMPRDADSNNTQFIKNVQRGVSRATRGEQLPRPPPGFMWWPPLVSTVRQGVCSNARVFHSSSACVSITVTRHSETPVTKRAQRAKLSSPTSFRRNTGHSHKRQGPEQLGARLSPRSPWAEVSGPRGSCEGCRCGSAGERHEWVRDANSSPSASIGAATPGRACLLSSEASRQVSLPAPHQAAAAREQARRYLATQSIAINKH